MPIKVTLLCKRFAALVAMEGLLSSVCPSMTIEVALHQKLFAALVTCVRFYTEVSLSVNLKL
jgi:hypothetical protein